MWKDNLWRKIGKNISAIVCGKVMEVFNVPVEKKMLPL